MPALWSRASPCTGAHGWPGSDSRWEEGSFLLPSSPEPVSSPAWRGRPQHRVLEPGWFHPLFSCSALSLAATRACWCLPLSSSSSSPCISLVSQALQSNLKYSLLPRRLLISKRLAQCLHPALPSGVHLKALETYEIIFKIVGTKWLAKDLFLYRYAAPPASPFFIAQMETY